MGAFTTTYVHLGRERVEVSANLENLMDEESNHRYWSLDVHSFGDSVGTADIIVFLSPDQLIQVADQLRVIITQLDGVSSMTPASKSRL